MCLFCSVEGLWLPLGPADGGGDAGCVFSDGVAVVRSSDRFVNLPRQQSEAGVGKRCSWGAATISGHQRAETNWPGYLPAHGLFCVYDWCFTGTSWILFYTLDHTLYLAGKLTGNEDRRCCTS